MDYPTSSLVNLVRAYKLWESQGGIRKSLFAPGGAQGPSDFNLSDFGNDEWNFSTTVDFDQSMMDTDATAVYDVYGSNVEFDFNEEFSRPPKNKPRRRLPPQLNPVKAPLEKIFDPNTISNYEENSRAYYGKAPPPPTSTTDLPLRDNSSHNTLRESLIDLDMSLHDGGHLSQFVDMDTLKAGPGPRISVDDFEEITDYNKPPLSDPADMKYNRRTQDWKFPSMGGGPPASANPEMSHFPFHEDPPAMAPEPNLRPSHVHHQTEPISLQSQPYDLMPPKPMDNRASVGSLIDLDESLPMPELTRPSTANSDVVSVSGSDIGGANPFDLERHASLYQTVHASGREPSIYISDDSDLARLANASEEQQGPPDLSPPTNGQSHLPLRDSGYDDDDGYSTSEYFDSDYLAMRSRSRSRSRVRSNGGGRLPRAAPVMTGTELPFVPPPPSARVMQGLASREEVRDDVMRLLASFSEHLGFANARVSSLPVRAGRRGGEIDAGL